MKNFLMSTVIAASSLFAMSSAQALQIEVAPLKPEIKAEILGVRAAVNGQAIVQDALVITGKSAAIVARAAGIAINTSVDMLVLTGVEVTMILDKTLDTTLKAGQTAIIQTAKLSKFALNTTLHLVNNAAHLTIKGADMGFDLVTGVLKGAGRTSLIIVSDAGKFVFAATNGVFAVVNFALKAVLKLVGIIL